MSAQRKPQSETSPKPTDWSQWIGVNDAAKRLEKSPSSLYRQCVNKLQSDDNARFLHPPDGGKPQWYIRRAWNAQKLFDLHPGFDRDENKQSLLEFTEKQRTQAIQRKSCVMRFRSWRNLKSSPVKSWIKTLVNELNEEFADLKVSTGSLYRWDKNLKNPSDIIPLIDTRGGDQCSRGSTEAWKYFKDIFLDDRQPSLSSCWRRTKAFAAQNEDQWCSLTSCRRQLDERIPPIEQLEHREPAKYRQQCAPYIQQDAERYEAGKCWVSDHAQLDLMCYYNGNIIRPWFTAWQDWRTRKIVGWVLSPSPNSHTILAAFYQGIKDPLNHGGPEQVWVDNGKDYDSFTFTGTTKKKRQAIKKGYIQESQFKGLFGLFSIDIHFSIAYNPNGKARMERWFKTMHEQFDVTFATYTGRDISHRPESLKKVLKDKRNVPSFDDVEARLIEYVDGFNAQADHQMHDLAEGNNKLSPAEAMANWCNQRIIHNEDDLELFMLYWSKPQRVTRNGVSVKIRGGKLHYGMLDANLRRLMRTKREVFVACDPYDIQSSVKVFNDQLRLITVAEPNPLTGNCPGATHQDVGEAQAQISRFKRAMKHVAENAELAYLSDNEVLARKIAENQSKSHRPDPTPPKGPQGMKLVQPDNSHPDTPPSEPVAKAAGAESYEYEEQELLSLDALGNRFAQSDDDDDDDSPVLASLNDLYHQQDDTDVLDDLVSLEDFDQEDTDGSGT